jgi:UDP-N-acetylglucosamine transferase subunit ALG13
MIDRFMLALVKSSERGCYEKTEQEYIMEFGENQKCIVALSNAAVEFKIKTIKWIPGSYEPIEGAEIYKMVMYEEIESLCDEEIIRLFSSIIDKIIN